MGKQREEPPCHTLHPLELLYLFSVANGQALLQSWPQMKEPHFCANHGVNQVRRQCAHQVGGCERVPDASHHPWAAVLMRGAMGRE